MHSFEMQFNTCLLLVYIASGIMILEGFDLRKRGSRLFAALLAACILTVVLALGQSDGALPNVGERVLSVPAVRAETQE